MRWISWCFVCLMSTAVSAAPLTAELGNGPPIPAPPELAASGYILIDATNGEVLVEQNADQPLPPASLTKMMTAYLVEREIAQGRASMDDLVPISVRAWKTGGSRMFVREGTSVRLEDLLRGIIIQSGNDASVAVAEYIAGSEDVFADLMTQTAQQMGMQNTRFLNATGLPADGHTTTARDLAILSQRKIADFPQNYAMYAEKSFEYNGIKQANRNTLLFRDPTVDGIKTGHTEEAGYCLVASAERDGLRLISVVMGTASERAREQETTKLLQYGFRYFSGKTLLEAGVPLENSSRKVWFGTEDSIDLVPVNSVYVTLPLGREGSLEAVLDAPASLDAPLSEGQVVGTLSIQLGTRTLAKTDVAVARAVPEGDFMKWAMDTVMRLFE